MSASTDAEKTGVALQRSAHVQSPEPEIKGVLLDAEGVTSSRGARIFTSEAEYKRALEEAGLGEQKGEGQQHSGDSVSPAAEEEEEQPRAAVSGV